MRLHRHEFMRIILGMVIRGDARHVPLRDKSVQCVVTSPPYWGLRDYQVAGQIGLELNEPYIEIARKRTAQMGLAL